MAFIDYILDPPSYGWKNEKDELIKPSPTQLFLEFIFRINIFKSKKNWLSFIGWFWVLALIPFFILFIFKYFSWWLLFLGFLYSMVGMGTHGTIWYHRYCTHKAFIFRTPFWRILTQHLVIKVVPEEIYVISHHVHHSKSDQPGDPYNANAGFLYCFLADTNHQPIVKDLNENDYLKAAAFLKHTGVKCNTFEQYQKWGSIAHPLNTIFIWIINWSFWYSIFFLIGGQALACALFAGALVWTVGVRTFNYEGHGKGHDKRKEGMDFNRNDMSINQYWPGIVAGEWHNNHHLFPSSARTGFLPYQLDFAWYYIYTLSLIGGITSFHNSKSQFYEKHYNSYRIKVKNLQNK
jgi:sn-1 stearoyl-lipid 9-desaturase